VRFGAVGSCKADPVQVITASLEKTKWIIDSIEQAGDIAPGRRQAAHMGDTAKASDAISEIDVICHLEG
jgi:hypothetical protein